MKKILLSVTLFIVFAQIAMSQNTFGIKAGMNVSNQYYSSIASFIDAPYIYHNKNLAGYQLGIFYKMKLSKKLTIASELNFSVVGSKTTYLAVNYNHDSELVVTPIRNRIGYLELPFSLQYHVNKFYVGLGPSIAFRLFSNTSITGVNSYSKTMDMAANLLVGYKLARNWDVNARYSYGLINTQDYKGYGTTSRPYILTNRFANVSLLYSFL